jgi:hypothetical protein
VTTSVSMGSAAAYDSGAAWLVADRAPRNGTLLDELWRVLLGLCGNNYSDGQLGKLRRYAVPDQSVGPPPPDISKPAPDKGFGSRTGRREDVCDDAVTGDCSGLSWSERVAWKSHARGRAPLVTIGCVAGLVPSTSTASFTHNRRQALSGASNFPQPDFWTASGNVHLRAVRARLAELLPGTP